MQSSIEVGMKRQQKLSGRGNWEKLKLNSLGNKGYSPPLCPAARAAAPAS